jgi:TfoX N-terminal domain
MFSRLTFMLEGNVLCCVSTKGLMVRVGAAAEPEALKRPLVARCLGAGRPMAGFLMVEPEGVASDADLRAWLDLALAYVGDLPPKKAKPRKTKSRGPNARHQFQENPVTQLTFDPPLFTVFGLVVLVLGLKAGSWSRDCGDPGAP